MAGEKIIVDVGPKGEVKIEAQNFKDSTCLKATKTLEEALGKVQSRTKKTEASIPAVGVGSTVKTGA